MAPLQSEVRILKTNQLTTIYHNVAAPCLSVCQLNQKKHVCNSTPQALGKLSIAVNLFHVLLIVDFHGVLFKSVVEKMPTPISAVHRLSESLKRMPQVIPSFFLLVWSLLVSSCSSYVNFIYPNSTDTGMTFNYIDTVYFTWTSSVVGPWMNLWCAPNQTSPQSKLQGKAFVSIEPPIQFNQTHGGGKTLKSVESNSVPRPSVHKWHQPSILSVQRIRQERRLSHAN